MSREPLGVTVVPGSTSPAMKVNVGVNVPPVIPLGVIVQ